ncbi:hypothetical protein LV457_17945 [Mycobacterium sp. MYCO198283]|uniref:hypothetical protein n=1 Tax=Mycobacterium sp. MYCO198283 TaxID=2883505 RepID=UPI001E46B119|nr:hypothetical protein [Mycobacterium sp. MYCO198283]MCG5434156.1 hypothetical protein [Mycobacterium sp. MYCO198283]
MERTQGLNRRPAGVDDATVEAVGKVSEALEALEEARGRLYGFHRLLGRADLLLGDGCEMLRKAGHGDVAERLEREVLGRNVLRGRWTFQIVEDFDDNYWSVFRAEEQRVRDQLQQGVRHVYEAEMKQDRRTDGRSGHEATPEDT